MKPGGQHPIKLSILERLRVSEGGLRYSSMRPHDIENDLYNYHLRQLVNQGLTQKRGERYYLTDVGLKLLMELNPVTPSGESHRFKMASLCLAVRHVGDQTEVLIQRRSRQPFAGESGLIGGGIMRGELAVDAAKRRLREEAGLQGDFELLGLIRKRVFDSAGQIYSDILFHVCISHDPGGSLVAVNSFGRQSWVPLSAAVEVENTAAIGSPKFGRILRQIGDNEPIPLFYIEEEYRRDPR